METQQLLFIFTHSPNDTLAWDAWDAVMTAGLLDQSVTIFFSGEGVIQLQEPRILEKIAGLQEFLPLRLCTDVSYDGPLGQVERLPPNTLSSFIAGFHRVLSF